MTRWTWVLSAAAHAGVAAAALAGAPRLLPARAEPVVLRAALAEPDERPLTSWGAEFPEPPPPPDRPFEPLETRAARAEAPVAAPVVEPQAPVAVRAPVLAVEVPCGAPAVARAFAPSPAAAAAPVPAAPPAPCSGNPRPAYPPRARESGVAGTVLVRLAVDAHGEVAGAEVAESSGSEMLDVAALEALRHWRFTPAKHGELAVASTVLVPVRFTLQDSTREES